MLVSHVPCHLIYPTFNYPDIDRRHTFYFNFKIHCCLVVNRKLGYGQVLSQPAVPKPFHIHITLYRRSMML